MLLLVREGGAVEEYRRRPARRGRGSVAELDAQLVGGRRRQTAGVLPADVRCTVGAVGPQWRVVALAPGDDGVRSPAGANHVEQVGTVAGDDDLGGAGQPQVEGQ